VPYAGAGPRSRDSWRPRGSLASGPAVVLPHLKRELRCARRLGRGARGVVARRAHVKELGYPDAEFYIWAGGRGEGDAEPILTRLRDAMRQVVADPAFKGAMDKLETPHRVSRGRFQRFFAPIARRASPPGYAGRPHETNTALGCCTRRDDQAATESQTVHSDL